VSATGAVKLYKFGREGSCPPKGIYDLSRFLSTHLGTKSQPLPGKLPAPSAALVGQRSSASGSRRSSSATPVCHADLMRRAFGKLVDIAPPRWTCKKCGKGGVFSHYTTGGSLDVLEATPCARDSHQVLRLLHAV
jgi:hypothetical protein